MKALQLDINPWEFAPWSFLTGSYNLTGSYRSLRIKMHSLQWNIQCFSKHVELPNCINFVWVWSVWALTMAPLYRSPTHINLFNLRLVITNHSTWQLLLVLMWRWKYVWRCCAISLIFFLVYMSKYRSYLIQHHIIKRKNTSISGKYFLKLQLLQSSLWLIFTKPAKGQYSKVQFWANKASSCSLFNGTIN